ASRPEHNERLLPGVDSPLQLPLVHLRATGDVPSLGLVVQLLLRAALGAARAGTLAAAAAGGDVTTRGARRLPRLALSGPFLVDRPGGNLLSALGRAALLLLALLDVLVLPLALVAPGSLRHSIPPRSGSEDRLPEAAPF